MGSTLHILLVTITSQLVLCGETLIISRIKDMIHCSLSLKYALASVGSISKAKPLDHSLFHHWWQAWISVTFGLNFSMDMIVSCPAGVIRSIMNVQSEWCWGPSHIVRSRWNPTVCLHEKCVTLQILRGFIEVSRQKLDWIYIYEKGWSTNKTMVGYTEQGKKTIVGYHALKHFCTPMGPTHHFIEGWKTRGSDLTCTMQKTWLG